MGRYLLDTNVLIFMMAEQHGCIHPDVDFLIKDYGSRLHVSSMSIAEIRNCAA